MSTMPIRLNIHETQREIQPESQAFGQVLFLGCMPTDRRAYILIFRIPLIMQQSRPPFYTIRRAYDTKI